MKTKSTFFRDITRDKYLYLMLLPGMLYFLVFKYLPMGGLKIAFQEYNMFDPAASTWVGFNQFISLFKTPSFPQVFENTLRISLLKLVIGFPAPIILALLLNEFRNVRYKKFTQTVLYLPHFISWVILSGIIITFISPTGVINDVIKLFGGTPIDFLTSKQYFVPMLIVTELYKSVGWGTIIYFAAISNVDEELFEAASIDGANKFKQIIHITLPCIRSTITIVFILNLGNILNAGFEQIFLLYNPMVYEVADVIDTYVYRKGIIEANYSFSTAAGLFKSVVALVLIVGTNYTVKRLGEEGIW